MIHRVSNEMKALITQIKQYKANETGKIEVPLIKVHPVIAINSSIDYFREKLDQKGIALYFTPPRSIASILADPVTLVSSVLNNIITNSIKFSSPGDSIKIKASEEGEMVIIEISDCGIGIPKEIISNMFNMKKATTRKGTNGELGTGFGMPILKLYMNKYGGEVYVESHEKQYEEDSSGTKFKLCFKKF